MSLLGAQLHEAGVYREPIKPCPEGRFASKALDGFGGLHKDIHQNVFGLVAVFLPVAAALGFRGEKLATILVMLGAPTTVSSYVMARSMGHEGTLTSNTVVLTTLVSAFTLTFWIWLLRTLGLI